MYYLPPVFPYWGLAIVFAYATTLSIYAVIKYRDYTYIAMIPSLLYMTLHYMTVLYVPYEVAEVWKTWGMFALGMSFIISKTWRLSYFLKRKSWKH